MEPNPDTRVTASHLQTSCNIAQTRAKVPGLSLNRVPGPWAGWEGCSRCGCSGPLGFINTLRALVALSAYWAIALQRVLSYERFVFSFLSCLLTQNEDYLELYCFPFTLGIREDLLLP